MKKSLKVFACTAAAVLAASSAPAAVRIGIPDDATNGARAIKLLETAGLIEKTRAAQFRPCRLRPQPLRDAADWMETYRRLWDDRLDRLEAFLQAETADPKPGEPDV